MSSRPRMASSLPGWIRFSRCAATASACTRLARLTMPTSVPPRSTGTRLMPRVSSRSAISATGVSGATETTSRVITSRACRACDLTYSEADRSWLNKRSHHEPARAWRSVPISCRCRRSPSLTMPTRRPSSRMGTALMRFLRSSAAISVIGVAGPAVMTGEVMMSLAFIECPVGYHALRMVGRG